ncbi:SusC/RagA family TonB-linked outer membrane protein [Mucilaginibacter sp. PPCGB 2223]|uniref:SusC/RagA family TonB-linked outer membrane protein n=1 Tax=Mucilaginibacter sp. PPCGB 2223 TaxID=1886027 RepID=UPI001585F99F|nr:SusC/RagA family TonB-linked outer membrane protein [Mucilaginibacter sp. PPCGB 2223]
MDTTASKRKPAGQAAAPRNLNKPKKRDSLKKASAVLLDSAEITKLPGFVLQQYLKGRASGLYIEEPTGEPGSVQHFFIRGTSVPLISARSAYETQPTVVVDGIPVISEDHPFAYDIQQYDFTRIGPATNLLGNLDLDNIASIEVLKDFSESGKYGPRAANGIIYITTKKPGSQKKISFNTYIGVATPNSVTTLNGASENNFRKPFYTKYATKDQKQSIAPYLRDSLYNVYYGPSNWTDLYYKNALQYNANISVSGGNKNTAFRIAVGNGRSSGVADGTALTRFNAAMALDMQPAKWLDLTISFDGTQLLRDRNKNLRDRFADVRYLPDLTNPVSPNKLYYGQYLNEYNKSFDNNKSNIADGYLNSKLTFGKFTVNTRLAVDYREGYRDEFFPSTLLETNSYVANYFGYDQRVVINNTISYKTDWRKTHFLELEAGQDLQMDTYRYNYGYAYHGTSDYIKLNIFDSPTTPTLAFFSYNPTLGFLNTLSYRFVDQTKNNLESFYANANYRYQDKYQFSLMLRADGSSNQQPTSRWFYSPILSATWHIKNDLLKANSTINMLDAKASYGFAGHVQQDDRFAAGPQYTVDIGYTNEPRLGTYTGDATLNRPYTAGWVGYGIPWAYVEQLNAGLDIALWKNKLQASVDFYSRTDHNELINVPGFAEYGYASAVMPGMKINNTGVDAEITAELLPVKSKLKWTSSVNINYNHNELKALPGGLSQIVIGTHLLRVGNAVDQYWVFQNQGIYNNSAEVPLNPNTGSPITFQGIPFQAGDPKWKDNNGDYTVDNNDKVLKGHSMPVVSGGFNNDFRYKNWGLAINMYYNLGRNIVNQDMAKRFDFINQESTNNINAVKEITFWEKRGDYGRYPIYNPWSPVIPYRTDQDLFLENASFIKMRSLSLSYDLTSFFARKKSTISKMLIYTSISNVFTITPYTGRDPELVDYTGYDTGYGQPIARTYSIGVKMDL